MVATPALSMEEFRTELMAHRQADYIRLKGGYSIPIAGMIYWLFLGGLGYFLPLGQWAPIAFFTSGLIFPLAMLIAKLLNNPFMKNKSALTTMLPSVFMGMLLFWVFIIAAIQEGPNLLPLILAVGMSIHWPVIGWSYGRTAIYGGHAIGRALLALFIWLYFPEERLTWLPLSVAFSYAVTIIVILIDVRRLEKAQAEPSSPLAA